MIKKTIPDACIGADVIVGFPGETSEDFESTFNYISKLNINYLHVFSYSNRTGTVASELINQVPKTEKINRSRSLNKLSNHMRLDFYKKNINTVRKVLFESKIDDNYVVGFTDNYIRVVVKGNIKMLKKIYNVKLSFIGDDKVYGELY